MAKGGSGKIIAVAVVWLIIFGAGAAVYRYLIAPGIEEETIRKTSSEPQLATSTAAEKVGLSLDSFSGYCFLRSPVMREELLKEGVELELVDDRANYARRLEALSRADTPLAVFTIDALLKTSSDMGKLPGTIVLVLDESRGADAMVAFKKAVPGIDALNRPDARIVVTRDSPSETLARVVLSRFNLPKLPKDSWVSADGAGDAYRMLQKSDRSLPYAYVLWEPYVSRILENPDVHTLIDTSGMKGKIVDVLVVERDFLLEHGNIVESVVKAYLRTVYAYQQEKQKTVDLVVEDARILGEKISAEQAARLTEGVWWKNTMENYAHMGIIQNPRAGDVQHIERMIADIGKVLLTTGAMADDPTDGSPNQLYYKELLKGLHDASFHPGRGRSGGDEEIREQVVLRALNEDECARLLPVGTLKMDPINFRTSSAELSRRSQRALETLAHELESWPNYYLLVRGHARALGDNPEANRLLASQRARAAAEYLERRGVAASRLCVTSVEPRETRGEFQSVTFVVGQLPF